MTAVHWVMIMLAVTATIYTVTAGAYWFAGRPGMALAFIGYVVGNIGFVWDALTTRP